MMEHFLLLILLLLFLIPFSLLLRLVLYNNRFPHRV